MPKRTGILLENLPAIYHSLENKSLHELLSLFEEIWCAAGNEREQGLEGKIAGISALFRPLPSGGGEAGSTPEGFLAWLSDWVALSERGGLSSDQLRQLIANIVPLYAKRGTKEYLERMLHYYLREAASVTVYDQDIPGLTVGRSSMGTDSRLGSDRPFFFKVVIKLDLPEDTRLEDSVERARAVIDLAKPAHTHYSLDCIPVAD
jgi:phage tail-like protein